MATGTVAASLQPPTSALTAESRTFVDLGAGQGAGGAIKGTRQAGGSEALSRRGPPASLRDPRGTPGGAEGAGS